MCLIALGLKDAKILSMFPTDMESLTKALTMWRPRWTQAPIKSRFCALPDAEMLIQLICYDEDPAESTLIKSEQSVQILDFDRVNRQHVVLNIANRVLQ